MVENESLPLRSGTKQESSFLPLLLNIVLKILDRKLRQIKGIWQEKEIQNIPTAKKKLSV